nr:hypothetical protein [Tanacetum cinerariifolium]
EFAIKPVAKNVKAKSCKEETKVVRKNDDASIIKEWVSDDEEKNVTNLRLLKIVRRSIVKKEFVKPRQQEKTVGKTVKRNSYGLLLWPKPSMGKHKYMPGKPKRKVTQVPQLSGPTESVANKAIYKELEDRLVLRSHGDTIAQTRFENVSKLSNDSLLARGNTLQSDEDRMKLNELMELCTNLQTRVHDLEKTQTTQANVIDSLKKRVKKLEKKNSLGEDASKQERRIDDIDADEDITLVNVQADAKMFDADKDLGGEELFVKQEVVADKEKIDEVTLAQALTEDKSKGILVEEPVKPKKKDQIRLDEEAALKLQAKFDEEQRLIDADHQLAERLQAEKQQELTDEEKATLFMKFLEKRRKFFAAKRVEEKRNKPQTQDQKRKIMYLRTKLVQGLEKEKRAGKELIQKKARKQKVEDDKETSELKNLMEIIPDKEEVVIDAIPLAVKSPGLFTGRSIKKERKAIIKL